MNLQAILIANMFGLILLICVFISIILTKQNRRLSDKIFMALIFFCIRSTRRCILTNKGYISKFYKRRDKTHAQLIVP